MKNKNLVPLWSILGGVLFLIIWAFSGPFLKSDNYAVVGTISAREMNEAIVKFLFVFALGAYVGAVVQWLLSKKEKDFIPPLVPIGIVIGAVLGFFLSGIFLSFDLSFKSVFGRALMGIGVLILIPIGTFLGGCLACVLEIKKSPILGRRLFIVVCGAVLLFSLPLSFLVKSSLLSRFPGEKAPISVRHDWASRKFEDFYIDTLGYLKGSSVLKNLIGEIKELAPTVGENKVHIVEQSAQPATGYFTLEVVGTKAKGIASVKFKLIRPDKMEFSGQFVIDGKKIDLENSGNGGAHFS